MMLLLKYNHVFDKLFVKRQTKTLLTVLSLVSFFFLLFNFVFLLFNFVPPPLCFNCRALIQSMLERCDRFLWSQQA